MVQQYQSPVRVYKHPFPLVMMAYERRFPTCPKIPVFVGCEIVSDEESKNGSIRITERRCKLNVEAPYILKKIIGVDFVYFIQRNVLDRRNSVLEIEAYNESFSSRVSVIEKCRYFVHPENPEWTCFEQTASLDIKNFFGFENSMEKLAMKQYAQNIAKGKEIIEYFINQLKEEGIVYVPPWKDPNDTSEKDEGDIAKSQESLDPEETYSCADNKLQNREMQLSSDYIERYLGKLDMMQESKLIQLRQSIKELRGSSIPGDATLLRFLRATEFSVEKAKEMLTQTLHWRKKHQIDKLLEEYDIPQVVKDYFPGGWHHFDKDGQPLYILRMGQMDVKGLLKSIGEDDLLLLVLHICEEGLVLMEEATAVSGHPVSQWCLLIDLEGLNMRHLWRPGIKALLRIIEIVEINYPETMGRVLIMRAPRCFPILWTLISTFINENTRKKFIFYCGTNYQEQGPGSLSDYIDPEFIPDFLGGSSEAYITEGGIVPKHLYKMELEPTSSQEEHNLYHCISLSRGQIHRVIIRSNDPGAILTWDFDVMRHNIIFTVLYQAYNDDKDPSLESVTAEDAELLEMKEIKGHFIKVEPSVVCHDGESIQGSHIMQDAGVYILQWHNQDDPGEFLPSISGHKAQLMYFYETLSSVHYSADSSTQVTAGSDIAQCMGCYQEVDKCQCQMIVFMFHETNRKLIELELLERLVGNVLTSLIHIRIKNHVSQSCDKTFDVSQLKSLENWLETVVMSWLIRIYSGGFSKVVSLTNQTRNAIDKFKQKLSHFLYETYTRFRIEQLFDIIIEYPDSQPAIDDLRICLERTDLRKVLIESLQEALKTRLLHPGVNTPDIITAYIAAIRALRQLDPTGVLLETITEPIKIYLRTREDTVRCVVSDLLDDSPSDLADELVKGESLQLDDGSGDEENEDWDKWMPDPVDADPAKSAQRRMSDIISMLVNVYGSQDLFVNEYRTLLADRLLSQLNYHTEREIRHLELLKRRFGENQLHYCEVMLKDVYDSKRIDGHIQSDASYTLEKEHFPTSALILSAQFWPPFKENWKLELPKIVQDQLNKYVKAFETLKGNRTLCWKPHLGNVNLEIELKDRKLDINVTPIHATIILHFQDKKEWALEELAEIMHAPATVLRRKITFWVSQGLLKEISNDVFILQEESSTKTRSLSDIVLEEEVESAMASASDQREEELQVFWSYIVGMLTNLDSMPLERIHQMLKMFASQGPGAMECGLPELRQFLDRKVREHQLLFSGGLYRLPKS